MALTVLRVPAPGAPVIPSMFIDGSVPRPKIKPSLPTDVQGKAPFFNAVDGGDGQMWSTARGAVVSDWFLISSGAGLLAESAAGGFVPSSWPTMAKLMPASAAQLILPEENGAFRG